MRKTVRCHVPELEHIILLHYNKYVNYIEIAMKFQ